MRFNFREEDQPESKWKRRGKTALKVLGLAGGTVAGAGGGMAIGALHGIVTNPWGDPVFAASDAHFENALKAKGLTKAYHMARSVLANPGAKLGAGIGAAAGALGTYGLYRGAKYLKKKWDGNNTKESIALHVLNLQEVSDEKDEFRRKNLWRRVKTGAVIGAGVNAAAVGHLTRCPSMAALATIPGAIGGGMWGGIYHGVKRMSSDKESSYARSGNLQEVFEPGGMASGALKTAGGWVKKKFGKGAAKVLGHAAGKVMPYAKTAEGAVQGVGKFALGSVGFEGQQQAQKIANRLTGQESDFNQGNLLELKASTVASAFHKRAKQALKINYSKFGDKARYVPLKQSFNDAGINMRSYRKRHGKKMPLTTNALKSEKSVSDSLNDIRADHAKLRSMGESSSILANRSLKEYGDYNSYDYANNHPALENPFNRPSPPTPYVPAEAPSNFVRHLKTAGKVALALGVVAGGMGAARGIIGRRMLKLQAMKAAGKISALIKAGKETATSKAELKTAMKKIRGLPGYLSSTARGIIKGFTQPIKTGAYLFDKADFISRNY